MNKRKDVQEARAFRLVTNCGEDVDDFRNIVKSKLRKLDKHTTRSVGLKEIRDRIFSGRLNVNPDGQRDIVCDEAWMTNLVTSIFSFPYPIEPLLVNAIPRPEPGAQFDDVWNVHRGKQRSSTLFAFFSGLVPIKYKKELYYWTDPREGPTGADYLFGRGSRGSTGAPHCLRIWNNALDLSSNVSGGFREGGKIFSQRMRDEFLSSTIDVQILPNWPGDASALCAVWGDVNCYKHTSAEFIYGIPCLAPLKALEKSIEAFAGSFGITGVKQPFLDLCRGYLVLIGLDFVPSYDGSDRTDAVAVQLCCEFVVKTGTHETDIQKRVATLQNAIMYLNDRADMFTGSNVKKVKTMTSDCLVFILMIACYHRELEKKKPGLTLDMINRTIVVSRSSLTKGDEYWKLKWVKEAPPTSKKLEKKTHDQLGSHLSRARTDTLTNKNLVPFVRALWDLHLDF